MYLQARILERKVKTFAAGGVCKDVLMDTETEAEQIKSCRRVSEKQHRNVMGKRHANEQKTTCALPFPATLLRKVLFDSVGITLPDEHAPVLKKTAPPSKSARLPSNWVSLIVTCVVQSIKKRSPKNSSTGQFFFFMRRMQNQSAAQGRLFVLFTTVEGRMKRWIKEGS